MAGKKYFSGAIREVPRGSVLNANLENPHESANMRGDIPVKGIVHFKEQSLPHAARIALAPLSHVVIVYE